MIRLSPRIQAIEGNSMTPRATVASAFPVGEKSTDTPSCANPSRARTQGHQPHPDIDPVTGRIRPISPEEWQARQEVLTRQLAKIDVEDDTPDEVYDEFMRNLDDERRRQGRPTAFDGCF
jgi:hypothetical protein